jgi:hypothetical protein
MLPEANMPKRNGIWLVLCVYLLQFGFAAGDAENVTAVDRNKALRHSLVHDKESQDWTSYLAHAEQLRTFLNGAPVSRLEIARARMMLSDMPAAKREIDAFLAMGQMHPILQTSLFRPLRTSVDAGFARNQTPISDAAVSFQFTDPGLLAEDVDVDRTTHRFFVTSVLEHKILEREPDGRQETFAQSPDKWPMMAIKVDAARRLLWATEVALDGFDTVARPEQGRSAILEYNIDTGSLLSRFAPAEPRAFGDMALAVNGDPLLSDNMGGGIYRFHSGALKRIDRGDFVSPQTVAVQSANAIFVPDYSRGLGLLNLDTGNVQWLQTQDRFALSGIDGLYLKGGKLVAVQNGAMPERVVAWTLDRLRGKIVGERIAERATASLGDPTHGVIVGGEFYYLANSGWDKLDDHGKLKQGAALTPGRLMKAGL